MLEYSVMNAILPLQLHVSTQPHISVEIFFCDSFRVRIMRSRCSFAGIGRQQLTVLTCEAMLTMT